MHLISYVHDKLCAKLRKGDYAFKIDLQDAYFHVPIHPSSRKHLRFAFRKQGVPVSSATIRSEHSPSGFYSFGARFLTSGIPIRTFQADDFYGRLHAGVGRSYGDSQISGTWTRVDLKLHINFLELKAVISALQHWASGPPGYDRHGQFDSSFIYQQARRDSFPHLAPFDSRSFPLVRGSEHNSPGKAYSRLSERDNRPPILSDTDRVVPPPRDRETHLQALGDTRSRHVCDSVELPPSSVHVSNSGAKSPSGGCSVSGLAGEVNVHVSSIPPAQQSHSETLIHSGGRGSSHSPLVAESVVVSTPTTSLCGAPPGLSLPPRSSVPAGSEVCLGRKVVPSARMEALM